MRRADAGACGSWSKAAVAFLVLAALLVPHASPVAAAAPGAVSASAERVLERRVKAAFLFRFTEFVTWPDAAFARPDSPFTILVAGREIYAEELRQITAGRTVSSRPVAVRRVSEGETMPAAHVLFVPDSERARLREWIRAAPRHALIVTESEGALEHGSVVNFVLVEGRVRFEIALDTADRRGLRMSSRLLALALAVRTGNP